MFTFIDTTTIEDINRSRREMRREIAGMLRGARLLRRHGRRADAVFAERHAADLKAWAGARRVPV